MREFGKSIALAVWCLLALIFPTASGSRVFSSTEQALASAFPGCEVTRRTSFLTDQQLSEATRQAAHPVVSALVSRYVAQCDGEHGGTAYFDRHRVRTLPETLLIVIDPLGAVGQIEVVSFDEPTEYIPRRIWYQQFEGERLDDELRLARDIDGVTGATLTARATTDAIRRTLAVHQVLERPAR